jgi:hypothetical protein
MPSPLFNLSRFLFVFEIHRNTQAARNSHPGCGEEARAAFHPPSPIIEVEIIVGAQAIQVFEAKLK